MSPQNPEYEKFKDTAVRARELEEAIGRLRLAVFWAALGPASVGLIHLLKITPGKPVVYGILATIPLSLVALVVYYLRLPPDAKGSRSALTTAFFTVLFAVATLVLAAHFSLLRILSSS